MNSERTYPTVAIPAARVPEYAVATVRAFLASAAPIDCDRDLPDPSISMIACCSSSVTTEKYHVPSYHNQFKSIHQSCMNSKNDSISERPDFLLVGKSRGLVFDRPGISMIMANKNSDYGRRPLKRLRDDTDGVHSHVGERSHFDEKSDSGDILSTWHDNDFLKIAIPRQAKHWSMSDFQKATPSPLTPASLSSGSTLILDPSNDARPVPLACPSSVESRSLRTKKMDSKSKSHHGFREALALSLDPFAACLAPFLAMYSPTKLTRASMLRYYHHIHEDVGSMNLISKDQESTINYRDIKLQVFHNDVLHRENVEAERVRSRKQRHPTKIDVDGEYRIS